MKFNKWTLGLAAVGAVSMASAVRADEAKLVPLNTALSNTTISGYVDVGAQYNMGNYSTAAGVPAGTLPGKVDNFSLNNVNITFDKPEDESPWASGYHIDINAGTDAVGLGLGTPSNPAAGNAASVALRQAYVIVRTPVGNGIDWKIGVQDDIIGYEGNTDGNNPNYTRSVGYFVEPTTLLGMVGSYKITDAVTVTAGLVNATTLGLNNSSDKTIAAAISLTAPDSFGWAKGATATVGALLNLEAGGQDNYYAGITIPTPVSALKVGAAFDLVSVNNQGVNALTGANNSQNDSGWVGGLYTSFQATDKLTFNLRGEYFDLTGGGNTISPTGQNQTVSIYPGTNGKGEEVTATIQYNLWANVISRAEFRWDHIDSGNAFANGNANGDSFLLAANLIYTF